MLSKKRLTLAMELGKAVATSNFAWFLNPANRGINFKWENIYSIVERFTIVHIPLEGEFGRDLKEMQEVAVKSSKNQLDFLIKESNLFSWIDQVK